MKRLAPVLALALVLYWLYSRFYYVGQLNDDAYYVLGARSLLQGRYVDLADPFGRAMPFFPPGFPLFLSPFALIFAPHWEALRLVGMGVACASALALSRLFGRWLAPAGSLLLLALYAGNAAVCRSASWVISDSFFTLLALSSFLVMRRVLERGEPAAALLLGALLGWEWVVRPTGLVLAASAAAGLLYARRWRCAALAAAPALAVWAGETLRGLAGHRAAVGYWPRLQESLGFLADPLAAADQLQRVANLFFVAVPFGLQLPYSPAGFLLSAVLAAACALLAARGARAAAALGRQDQALVLAMALFALGLLAAQASWAAISSRYALPVLPLLLGFLVLGAQRRLSPWPGRGLAALAALILLGSHAAAWRSAADAAARPAQRFPARTLAWLSGHVPAEAVLLSPRPAMTYLYTGRRALADPRGPANDREEFRYSLLADRVSSVVDSPMDFLYRPGRASQPAAALRLRAAWLASWPRAFQPVFSDPEEATTVYEVAPDPAFLRAYGLHLAARRQLAAGRLQEGLRSLDSALAVRPDLVKALNAYGAACLLAGTRLDAAEARLKRALRQDPRCFWAWLNLSRLYRLTRRPELARSALERAAESVSWFPNSAELSVVLGQERELSR
ncbi:MAG: hypothetical protein PHU21_10725 [Elusimicrobia bacterium]|nr:hypothetical protein [Elusimicrobiota bacterium]